MLHRNRENGGNMAGIEDFVVEQIMQDFQNSPQAPQAPSVQQPQMQGGGGSSLLQGPQSNVPMAPGGSVRARAEQLVAANPNSRVNPETGQAWGAYADQYERERVGALQRRDEQRFKILQGLQGLDPQIQAVILKRLGIDPGAVKSQIEQQKEVLKYKQSLEQPQQETQNAIRMLLATQGGQQNAAELAMKERAQQQEQASRGQTQNIQLMRVLATLMQSDASGKLQQTLGPLLMQMLQGAGINLTPQQPTGASAGGRAGIKITRE